MSINRIFTDGVLVDLCICAWSGEKQLTAEDLGLNPKSLPKTFKLGRKTLVDPDILRRIKRQDDIARKLLIQMSFPFPFGGARFVPKKAIPDFLLKFEECKQEYEKLADEMQTNFVKEKLAVRPDFVKAAKDAYHRLSQLPDYKGLIKEVDGKFIQVGEDEFINGFIERIDKSYPSQKEIRNKYSMSYSMYQMELPDIAAASYEDVCEENEKIQILKAGYQARMIKEIKEYATKIVTENRERVTNIIRTLKASLQRKARITDATLNAVTRTIDNFVRINIVNDVALEDALKAYKAKYLLLDPKTIVESDAIQADMVKDLEQIEAMACNVETMAALAQAYRHKIGMNGSNGSI